MMRIILLLLVTLMGPFCTFTQASTLASPTSTLETKTKSDMSAVTVKEEESFPNFSTLPPVDENTEKMAATTEGATVASTKAQEVESKPATEIAAPTEATESTKAGTEQTNGTNDTTGAPTDIYMTKVGRNAGVPESVETDDEAMGTGQVVGIVIGALIGVIVVIAIIILVVRRMGQYSPAKKRKPQKQESILISPLKRKARQEEKKKKSGKF